MRLPIAFLLLIAGITVLPEAYGAPRFSVVDHVIGYIVAFSESIRERGLDPLLITRETWSFALPVPVIFNTYAIVEGVKFNGLSNIIINSLNYDFATSLLTFDLAIPHIHLSAEIAEGQVTAFDNRVDGEISGSLDLSRVSFKGGVLFRLTPGGAYAESAVVDLSIGKIESAIKLNVGKYDVTESLNNFINIEFPRVLQEFKTEVNELFAIYTVKFLNSRH